MSRKFNTKKFIRDVLNDNYALVIGNEIILDTQIEPTGDVHQYFLKKVNENSNVQYESYHEIALDKNERINPVRRLIEDDEIKFRTEDISKDLMALLETRLFTTVLTTTTGNTCPSVNKADFVSPRTHVLWSKPCSFSGLGVYKMTNEDFFPDKLKELYLHILPNSLLRSLMNTRTS